MRAGAGGRGVAAGVAVGGWRVRACLQGARVGEGEGEGALAVELVDLVEVDGRVLLRDAAWLGLGVGLVEVDGRVILRDAA